MPEITLVADAGRDAGTSAAKRLRAAGKVPGVVYGHGMDPLPVAVDARALRGALTTEAGLNALLSLKVEGADHLTMAREIQRDRVRGTVLHVDFQIVRRDEVISADVPINLVGDAIKVHRGDGVVSHELFSLTVQATPDRLPHSIEVDVAAMEIGDHIRVADLQLPEGVTTEVDPEATIVVAQPPQVSESDLVTEDALAEAAEAAAAEDEAGEAAEGEGGEAAAPEAAGGDSAEG